MRSRASAHHATIKVHDACSREMTLCELPEAAAQSALTQLRDHLENSPRLQQRFILSQLSGDRPRHLCVGMQSEIEWPDSRDRFSVHHVFLIWALFYDLSPGRAILAVRSYFRGQWRQSRSTSPIDRDIAAIDDQHIAVRSSLSKASLSIVWFCTQTMTPIPVSHSAGPYPQAARALYLIRASGSVT